MSENEQKIQEIKSNALRELVDIYVKLIENINKLSINPQLRSHAYMNLDQGIYWLREGILGMEVKLEENKKESEVVLDAEPQSA